MATKDIEFRVGIIILLGLIILGGSMYWLRDYNLERNSQLVIVRFDDVGTLAVGDKVTVAGVRAGKVRAIRLSDNGVLVELILLREVVLKKDTRFIIKNFGLMGERFVAITPGLDTAAFDVTQTALGQYDAGLPEVMGLMGEMITELRALVGTFKRTIGSDSSMNKFNQTIGNLERISGSLADYVERNESKLDKSTDNFYNASRELNRMLSQNGGKVDSTVHRLDRITMRLDDFVVRLDTLSISLRQFANNINNPEGTLQLLTEDRRLYDDLRKTADNIDDLITDIRANPQKYISLKVELF